MKKTKQEIAEHIRTFMTETESSLLEAIVHVAEKYSIDETTMARYIRLSPDLKEELRVEAESLRMIKV